MKYIVQYTVPHDHIVAVGIEAEGADAAIAKAKILIEQGDIWMDTAVPLLSDDFEEKDDAVLEFTVERELADADPWPEADGSVKDLLQREAAFRAANLLVEAYRRGKESGGSVDWGDLDQAYEAALEATDNGGDRC